MECAPMFIGSHIGHGQLPSETGTPFENPLQPCALHAAATYSRVNPCGTVMVRLSAVPSYILKYVGSGVGCRCRYQIWYEVAPVTLVHSKISEGHATPALTSLSSGAGRLWPDAGSEPASSKAAVKRTQERTLVDMSKKKRCMVKLLSCHALKLSAVRTASPILLTLSNLFLKRDRLGRVN
jgi:hypothetical protein